MDPASFVLQASIAVAVVGILTILTALALAACLKRDNDVDSLFWYGFSGLSAVIFAIIGAAATIPGSGGLVTAGALVCVGVAAGWLWRGEHERKIKLAGEALRRERETLKGRHERVLQQWVSYELDPAAAIDFPAMTDLSRTDTSRLIRSMRTAALLRERFDAGDAGSAEYSTALTGLEDALAAAEVSAGVSRDGVGPTRSAHGARMLD
ncbi:MULTISPECIES: hypothetical protein [unclassified Arthrobacter]|uniref:hypothetical protein n=1 Tax=unclassified Arthrobacter TaxID=235627 RepID=UPI001490F30B|nr:MULTISPECIES: hypothetical protein [unclassified Arthrobacter]MBE0008361.1 hypothetical protein [Arthrobacter sp. AET 35A]NOJ62100.1 hypothetical protein [Arthrobacter sp. 147(2020)]